MPRRKARTSITIPKNLLRELDRKAGEAKRTRSDLVCEAVARYFASEEERLLAEGYLEMSACSAADRPAAGAQAKEVWPGW